MRFFLFLFAIVHLSPPAQAQLSCREIYTEESFTRALQALAKLKIRVESGAVHSRTGTNAHSLRVELDKKTQETLNLLHLEGAEKTTFLNDLRAEVIRLQTTKNQGPQVERDARIKQKSEMETHSQLTFKKIEPVPIAVETHPEKRVSTRVDVVLLKPFALAAFPTTQVIWKEVVQAAQRLDPKNKDLPLDPSKNKGPTLPVENVTFITVYRWIEVLNELVAARDPVIAERFPDLPTGAQFRLPTLKEWIYVATAAGTRPPFLAGGSEGERLGWFSKAANGKSQRVGEREPIILNGTSYWDLYGNVWQMTGSKLNILRTFTEERDQFQVITGGSFNEGSDLTSVANVARTNAQRADVGFRLAIEFTE